MKYSKYILEKLAYSGEDKLKRQEGDQQTDEEVCRRSFGLVIQSNLRKQGETSEERDSSEI